eukprot:1278914-Alexandrium_andersonii.AAC.1
MRGADVTPREVSRTLVGISTRGRRPPRRRRHASPGWAANYGPRRRHPPPGSKQSQHTAGKRNVGTAKGPGQQDRRNPRARPPNALPPRPSEDQSLKPVKQHQGPASAQRRNQRKPESAVAMRTKVAG